MEGLRILRASFIIAVDAEPVQLPARVTSVLLPPQCCFRLAGDDAGVAAYAGVDGHGHAQA